jgi:hypothetical protein
MNIAVVFAFGWMLAAQNPYWRLPAIVEALRDVEVHPLIDPTLGEQRGVLYSGETFQIRKGERFQMIKIYGEGGCRIRFKNREHDVSSCHWLEGFSDPEADIYKVISGHVGRLTSDKR